MSKKIGRNDMCLCGSNKKYKKCCLLKEEQEDKEDKEVHSIVQYLRVEFPTHKVIDITNKLTVETYRPLQIQHYSDNVIQFAEKNELNASVFLTRVPLDTYDIMILYHGSYRTFPKDDIYSVMASLRALIYPETDSSI
jgi:hypothetical protein